MEKFYLSDYNRRKKRKTENEIICEMSGFKAICDGVLDEFHKEWDDEEKDIKALLDMQKNAIIGKAKEVSYFKNKIAEYISKKGLEHSDFPGYYDSIEDAIYQENWGMAGIAEWFSSKNKSSSSCKVIGNRIYFQENGKLVEKPQTISKERREQLIRALLLATPNERVDKDFHEVYMTDGTRITIFKGNMVKEGQEVIVFRRYIIAEYSFEEQAKRGTIPQNAIKFFENMVKLGFSIAATGAMKTGKTSFLATYQSYENPNLEGVMLETDPEISLHKLMPKAPIIQLLAKDDRLKSITRQILRSDADYLIMAEARDGVSLDTVLRLASKGTRRLKITFHSRNPFNFPYDVASEVAISLNMDIDITAKRVAQGFDYIFHFVQLKDKSKKRLKGIYEITYDARESAILITQICKYIEKEDNWKWNCHMSEDKILAASEEDEASFEQFAEQLEMLANKNPMSREECDESICRYRI
ncbi:MAG: ATPase [Eubacteriales bacterium]